MVASELNFEALEGRPEFESTMIYKATRALLLIWWLFFFYPFLEDLTGQSIGSASELTSNGSLYNQLVIASFALLGMVHLSRAVDFFRTRQGHAMTFLVTLYLAWSAASIGWSDDRAVSIRRLIAFVLLLTGCFGLGAGFYARSRDGVVTLARHIVIATAIAVVLLIVSRFKGSSLSELLDPHWNLKDSTRIASWAYPGGYAALASLYIFRGRDVRRFLSVAGFIFLLVVLKGRTMIADALAPVLLVHSWTTRIRLAAVACMVAGSGLTLFITDLITGGNLFLALFYQISDAIAAWLPYITMGDGAKNITTLSGRLPLWRALYPYILDQPFQGYGFGAFWNATRFDDIDAACGWSAVIAHNGFLDEMLGTGVIGLVLFLSFWGLGMYWSLQYARQDSVRLSSGYLVFGWLLMFLFFNSMDSILQSFLQFPTFASFTGLFAILNMHGESELEGLRSMLDEGFMVEEIAS